ncbi:MAG: DUF1990 domain-containing protein [Roseiflexaceae bacterium]
MFLLAKPSDEQIRNIIAAQRNAAFSYLDVGATSGAPPVDFRVDHNRVRLGVGEATFNRAVAAVQRWEMFNFPWMHLCWPDASIAVGTTVALVAASFGLWTLSACRIVYLIEEAGPTQRYGFAYGTLPEHVARGEERFQVEWSRADDSVYYDILAFSQPNQILTRIGYPAMRSAQKRFARDSKRAMVRAMTADDGR